MPPLHDETVGRLLAAAGPPADDVIEDMDERARREGFPTVGPEVGATLAICARLVGAERAFECGSGYGYSAYWIARALPADGEVVLTDLDPELLADAREYFERGGLADRARFEAGDAVETLGRHDGPFDLILIDNHTDEYVETFELARERLAPGGAVVADNVIVSGDGLDTDRLVERLEGGDPALDDTTAATAAYYEHLRTVDDFETAALPIGEGATVSVHTG
jgi:predicted O-methyltransferase YrrM